MSTDYRVCGRGVRLTRKKLESLACQCAGEDDLLRAKELVRVDPEDGHLIVHVGDDGYLHFGGGDVKNPRSAWNWFTRFGGNYGAAETMIECLNAAGYSVLSEHDEGYFS